MLMAGAPGFWGITIKPQKQFLIDLQYDEIVHLTQVSGKQGFPFSLDLEALPSQIVQKKKTERHNWENVQGV